MRMPATAVIHPAAGTLLHSIIEFRSRTVLGGIVIALFEMTIFSQLDRAVLCGRHNEAPFRVCCGKSAEPLGCKVRPRDTLAGQLDAISSVTAPTPGPFASRTPRSGRVRPRSCRRRLPAGQALPIVLWLRCFHAASTRFEPVNQ